MCLFLVNIIPIYKQTPIDLKKKYMTPGKEKALYASCTHITYYLTHLHFKSSISKDKKKHPKCQVRAKEPKTYSFGLQNLVFMHSALTVESINLCQALKFPENTC